jgi:DNA-binding LytR/AlgR family response regulator
MLYSFLIIDDDLSSAADIAGVFNYFPKYKHINSIKDNENVVTEIARLKPELVIYVVSPPKKNDSFSFSKIAEMHQFLEKIPYFIVVSKDDIHALEAIQSGISDYLIKPLSINNLGKSLFKFEKKNNPIVPLQICIKSYTDYQFINLADIIYLRADNNTTDFHLCNGKFVNAYKTLKYFEKCLPPNFLRIHKSYMVNIHYVSRIQFAKLKCILDYEESIPFTSTYRMNIDAIVKKMSSN